MTTLVLVHNAWLGAWSWEATTRELRTAGVASVAVELPRTGLAADVGALTAAVGELTGPIVICGHSYGGAVVAHALPALTGVAAVAYLCSFVPGRPPVPPGRPTALGAATTVSEDGVRTIDPAGAEQAFFADCPPADRAVYVGRLRPTVLRPELIYGPASPVPSDVPWHYAICTEDRAMDVADQREAAAGAASVVTWPTGHSPMLSRPDLVAAFLAGIVATVTPPRAGQGIALPH
jgi:pimeloyl-ACP methyl ester carboxylesterase